MIKLLGGLLIFFRRIFIITFKGVDSFATSFSLIVIRIHEEEEEAKGHHAQQLDSRPT
jgi:hypothetical protein